MRKRDLQEQRHKLIADMRGLTEKPSGEAGDLSSEQAEHFERAKAQLKAIEGQLERLQYLEDAERREAGTPVTGSGDRQLDEELRSFSLIRAIAAQSGMDVDAGRERELSQELQRRSGLKAQGIMVPMQVFEKRVMTSTLPSGGPGSNLISTDLYGNQFIDLLRAKLVIGRSGARVLSGLQGNVDIPGLAGSSTAGWVAENAALSSSDMTFRKVSMNPKHVGALTEFSRNMLLQSTPDIEQLARDDFAKILAQAVDKAALQGGGTNEPTGILETSDINTVTFAGTAPTWAEILEFIAALEIDNTDGSGWATHPTMVKLLRSTPKEVDGSSVAVSADYLMEGPGNLAGYGLISSTQVPTNLGTGTNEIPLIFGNWIDLIVGYWSAFDLLVNPYESTAYSKGNVQVRGMLTCDVAVRHPESFCVGQLAFS